MNPKEEDTEIENHHFFTVPAVHPGLVPRGKPLNSNAQTLLHYLYTKGKVFFAPLLGLVLPFPGKGSFRHASIGPPPLKRGHAMPGFFRFLFCASSGPCSDLPRGHAMPGFFRFPFCVFLGFFPTFHVATPCPGSLSFFFAPLVGLVPTFPKRGAKKTLPLVPTFHGATSCPGSLGFLFASFWAFFRPSTWPGLCYHSLHSDSLTIDL